MAKVSDVINLMNYFAPQWMAAEGDVVGLQAGCPDDKVKNILVALDATDKVVDYAVKNKYQMIVTHHPRFYRPLNNIRKDSFAGNIAYKLCRNNIALFNAHTNFDAAPGGVNDVLADIAGVEDAVPIEVTALDSFVKLTAYVPEDDLEIVRQALADIGVGEIGNYSECSYRTLGVGVFKCLEDASPAIGNVGEITEVSEWRIEVVLPESLKRIAEKVLLSVHPYEQPAYDFTRLVNSSIVYGQGRVGKLKKEITLLKLAKKLKKATSSNATHIIGSKEKILDRIAVWSGSGVNIDRLVSAGVQCVVCGELGYHLAEELEYYNISAIVLGHGPCEEIALKVIVDNLRNGINDVNVVQAPRLWPDFVSI